MAEKGLSKKTYWIYGIGVSYFILDQIYNQWLSYYYLPPANEQTLKPLLTPILLILAFIFGRIIDAVTDPLVGYLSDNSKSKYGRRSFFMLLGGLPLALTMILFFFPLRSSIMATFLWVALINGLFFTAYTLVGGPYNALI
ncbi:MAG: MFS transporter, partial [Leptotrichiaceae bacterium]